MLPFNGRVDNVSSWTEAMPRNCLRLCLLAIVGCCLSRKGIILFHPKQQGRLHRYLGAAHLIWMVLGLNMEGIEQVGSRQHVDLIVYDVLLGLLGVLTTLSAARDFPHIHVRNSQGQSGTLSDRAIVTQSEMIEHSFYQFLNLWQAIYLHAMSVWGPSLSFLIRLIALTFVSSPWWGRKLFPVNSFSANWKETPKEDTNPVEVRLYQVKKCQYLFYKHVILHGINISTAVWPQKSHRLPVPVHSSGRVFWIALNASYVLEFFSQTMVKRKLLSQSGMLWFQRLLMSVSSVVALEAIPGAVEPWVCAASLLLNLAHRHHDVINTLIVGILAATFSCNHNNSEEITDQIS